MCVCACVCACGWVACVRVCACVCAYVCAYIIYALTCVRVRVRVCECLWVRVVTCALAGAHEGAHALGCTRITG